ncbi:tRNA (cytidine(34)-2'-O)-methyltransferase [Helicobacter cappadocius]|uniref:Putative tRNA (cytidine(34)-2'-O)-methyltransferase n=1 Tax=Helicobacter cappadocius TaxID=3063998 RepID=A0AA90Q023_9HELI|nr:MULTISPECIES: tRNA (cytidine(34)-2'-O)-methyltransferase [unclassified Helicobacter]MDO7253730.1 tRNA (cytidine(34)-2'-O)-methyltransferase [Helicobacter sp. faydin-H75]MDP2539658.1 tRNA (cytidine(34)-2'-O)-methyltransferase [Helicobacter sp. faydin-H76]
MLNIILIEPRIPQNTGNIGRLCVAGNARLHLIHPLGFSIDEKSLKRAGMDYWKSLCVKEWENIEEFWKFYPVDKNHFFLSTKAKKIYYEANFENECFLYFGREDAGINKEILSLYPNQTLKIPMTKGTRSINLATSVGAVLYEAIRQNKNYLEF